MGFGVMYFDVMLFREEGYRDICRRTGFVQSFGVMEKLYDVAYWFRYYTTRFWIVQVDSFYSLELNCGCFCRSPVLCWSGFAMETAASDAVARLSPQIGILLRLWLQYLLLDQKDQ